MSYAFWKSNLVRKHPFFNFLTIMYSFSSGSNTFQDTMTSDKTHLAVFYKGGEVRN